MAKKSPLPMGAVWTKQAQKATFKKNPMQTVFKGSANFQAAGKGFRSRSLDLTRSKFRSA